MRAAWSIPCLLALPGATNTHPHLPASICNCSAFGLVHEFTNYPALSKAAPNLSRLIQPPSSSLGGPKNVKPRPFEPGPEDSGCPSFSRSPHPPLAQQTDQGRRASHLHCHTRPKNPPNDRRQHQVMSTALPKAVPRLLSSISRSPSLSIRPTLRTPLMITICRLDIAPWPELRSPRLSAIASRIQPRTCPFHICNALIARRVSHFSSSALLHLETRHQASVRYSKLHFLLPSSGMQAA